ncbi:PREDICTED: uncharacterized protein PFB0145c-like isoform X2 [Cyphomyrmex costatus]|uniref:Coiled-coil domain-containing protein 9 n=2 Tax=Cyphomyrmex costatus TaxID=456900 RepID=A0A195CQG3_9HYME|nr:PREDICTED: uncharacterized protein PFB0145c-like isoform X2 [Cyphomyrmex costatus]XP_018395488.1 PREDICTED: uncharacterized protein PFB0145c-like isoform X2 [Cyphomyrmex costatus]XP_018395489.1 PREDICTED: uncharacterized protein PFB0145c-like isoform X2 [Cyphomyrmex costatus]KYN02717.1 hypothetical protein ALC62_06517 [Cyphomyrmex costatus]
MAANTLEEKINKIRQQNEEIKRRHEEVEEDKKNAAKLNALVQMVPSTDWPERKEPPEFSNPSRTSNKIKFIKEHHEHPQQYQSTNGEGRKVHTFAQGQGPPPDPKYNFLADAEREGGEREGTKDNSNRGQKHSRGMFKKKPGGKDGMQRDCRTNRGSYRDEHQPEYEAWRAERNRIDEDRISRQRTAEGNWRREWDNNKAHIVDEMARTETKLEDHIKKDFKDFDKKYNVNGNDYISYNRGNHRSYRGNSRHFHNNYENNSNSTYQVGHFKNSSSSEKRTVVATDKSIKITLNQENMAKGPVMSVKVNSPSIAGTGRVGPRQKSRVTYSSHSDVEVTSPDTESFSCPKLYEDRPKGTYCENLHESSNWRKSQLSPKKKDFSNKSPYFRKKEIKREDESLQKYHKIESPRKEYKESHTQKFYQSKSQNYEENTAESQDITTVNKKESNIIFSKESDMNNIGINNMDNQNSNLNSHINETREIYTDKEDEADLQNLDLSSFESDTEIIEACEKDRKKEDKLDELQNVQTIVTFECKNTKTKLITASLENNNDENKTQYVENLSCDANKDTRETIMKNEDSERERTKKILTNNCDNKQTKDMSEQEKGIKHCAEISLKQKEVNSVMSLSLTDVDYNIAKQSNKLKSDYKAFKGKEILAIEDEVITDEKINTGYKQDVTKCINETKEDTKEKERNVANSIIIDKIESLKEDLHIEEKAASSD